MAKSRVSRKHATIHARKELRGRSEQERFRATERQDHQKFLVKVTKQRR